MTTCIHTALEDLPTLLADAGINVIVADGYINGQCDGSDHYRFSDPDTGAGSHDYPPSSYMIHHTATTSYTPPPAQTSKAGAWAGVYRDGKLYPTGEGVPTIYLASAGPARISSGYGFRPAAWDYTFKGKRAPTHAQGSDGTTALNRYSFNIEIVHPGDGGELDKGVWEAVVILGQILERMFGWTEGSLGHTSWSTRKIDPKLSVGLPNDGADCIIDFQNAITDQTGEIPVTEEQLRAIIREEVVYVLGGDRIQMPDQARFGNQGVVNSIWHAQTHGERMMDQLWRAAESGDSSARVLVDDIVAQAEAILPARDGE